MTRAESTLLRRIQGLEAAGDKWLAWNHHVECCSGETEPEWVRECKRKKAAAYRRLVKLCRQIAKEGI